MKPSKGQFIIRFIRSLVFYLLFTVISLFFWPQFLLAKYLFKDATLIRTLAHVWVYCCLLLARKILGISYEFKNLSLIQKAQKPFIIASKHQSMWEAFAFFHEFGDQAVGVSKKEIQYYPILSLIAPAIKSIFIDRKAGLEALQHLLRESKKRLQEGYHIVIFPEGTRTPVGQSREYKRGTYNLYKHLKVPVVTIALNSGLFWPAKTFLKTPGKIIAEVTGMIDPGLSQENFQNKLQELIEIPSQKLSQNSS